MGSGKPSYPRDEDKVYIMKYPTYRFFEKSEKAASSKPIIDGNYGQQG